MTDDMKKPADGELTARDGNLYIDHAGEVGTMGDYSVIGHPLVRKDALEKVTGAAVFGPDVAFPDQMYAAIYQSPHAHAKILSYDLAEAKAVPGVRFLLTGEELPTNFGAFIADQPILARGKVRYHGEPVVAIAADTAHAAMEAAGKVRVEYELLEPVLDPYEALQPGALPAH